MDFKERYRCRLCGVSFGREPENSWFMPNACPKCGGAEMDVITVVDLPIEKPGTHCVLTGLH